MRCFPTLFLHEIAPCPSFLLLKNIMHSPNNYKYITSHLLDYIVVDEIRTINIFQAYYYCT